MKFEHINCNICGTEAAKSIGKRKSPDGNIKRETNIVQCPSCGLIYPDPMPRPDDDETQKSFEDPESYFSGGVTEERINKCDTIMRFIEKFNPGKGMLLDIGCGRGELAYVAKKRGWKVTATEISNAFAQYAKEKLGIEALRGDINDLHLPEESFDACCLNSVIQYVRDPFETVKKTALLLKKDAVLYIEVTNEDAFIFKISDFFKSMAGGETVTTHLSPLFPSFQIYGFNKKALFKLLSLAGFDAVYFKVKGLRGGGSVKGRGLYNMIINIIRKIIIFAGGITGNGHLIYCLAKKRSKT